MKNSEVGSIHSIETMGTVDGPGIRTVVFMQGCPLRCAFCHNVDCVPSEGGKGYTPDSLFAQVIKNKPYWKNEKLLGGVTFSGGEPTFQPEFLLAMVKLLHKQRVHIVVDSSLMTTKKVISSLVPYIDLWMVSVKHMEEKEHRKLTGFSNIQILENIQFLDTLLAGKPKLRLRYLVIPSVTDTDRAVKRFRKFILQLSSVESVELLPYGTHGVHKWLELYGNYRLQYIQAATQQTVNSVADKLSNVPYALKIGTK